MTTTNIQDPLEPFLKTADDAHEGLVAVADERNQQLIQEATEAQRAREVEEEEFKLAQRHARIAERARQQLFDDKSKLRDEADAKRAEEARQLGFILGNGEPEVREAEPQVSDDEPEPQAPEPEVHVVTPLAAVERTATLSASEVKDHFTKPSDSVGWFNAILGVILGLAIAGNSVDSVFEGISNVITYGLLATGWFISWSALGYFGFGWIDWKFRHRHRRQH